MKGISKKGQTEDFVADLIPSVIIIVIGFFILSTMQGANEKAVEGAKENMTEYFQDKKTITDYLSQEVKVGDKNIPLREVISLSYKNEAYQDIVEKEIKKIQGQRVSFPDFYTRVVCLSTEIKYPDGDPKIIQDTPFCAGTEKIIYLPTYGSGYLTMNFTIGVALGEGSSGV